MNGDFTVEEDVKDPTDRFDAYHSRDLHVFQEPAVFWRIGLLLLCEVWLKVVGPECNMNLLAFSGTGM
jgi:hypothetical protein